MTLPGFENIDGMTRRAINATPLLLKGLRSYGIDEPIKSPEIEEALSISGVEVRAIVSSLRKSGEPIASTSKGYYWATKPSELETTIGHIEGRMHKLGSVREGLVNARFETISIKRQQVMDL